MQTMGNVSPREIDPLTGELIRDLHHKAAERFNSQFQQSPPLAGNSPLKTAKNNSASLGLISESSSTRVVPPAGDSFKQLIESEQLARTQNSAAASEVSEEESGIVFLAFVDTVSLRFQSIVCADLIIVEARFRNR